LAWIHRRLHRWLLGVLAAVALLVVFHPFWLAALARCLIRADDPAKADLIVVLGGDWYGNRIRRGAELARQGYAAKVLVSGPGNYYGLAEADLAIPFAARHGYPADWFIAFPVDGNSTFEEAREVVVELRRRGVRRVLIVTSDYHTRRAGRIFRSRAPDLEIRMVAAADAHFRAESWWRHREGRKTMFYESVKMVTSLAGM